MVRHFQKLRFFVPVVLVVVFTAFAIAPSSGQTLCSTGVCVTTWQNDTYRTGDNLNESTLTYNTISPNTFGHLCSVAVDG